MNPCQGGDNGLEMKENPTIVSGCIEGNMTERRWSYRGWLVVGLASLGMVATLPGRTVGLGLITEPLLSDLAVSKTSYASLTFWATLLGSTFSLACGPAIDRWGVRFVLPGAGVLVGATALAMGRYVGPTTLLVFLILSRGFGQSSLSTASVTSVGKWFSSQLGIALAVFSAFVAFGFATAIPLLGGAITVANWRQCWMLTGLVIALFSVVAFVLLPKREPNVTHESGVQENRASASVQQAIMSPVFWGITCCTALYYLVLSGLTLFNEAVIAELGFGRNVFILAMSAMMGAGLLGNFLFGWLCAKVSVMRMLGMNMVLLGVVLASFPWLDSPTRIACHAAVYGVVGGAFAVLFFTGYSKAFGKQHLGKIQGIAQVIGVIASALGPVLLAQTESTTGSFLPAFRWLAPAAVAMGVAAWLIPMPKEAESTILT